MHVKGFTKLNEHVREDLRGTYAGLASEPAIEYLTSLGVTAVELLPIHHIADEAHLAERGLTNYWGYSSIGFLAPHALYAATGTRGEQVREFKGMVKALHRAGIEVILDVVYNHTAEGNHLGPMLEPSRDRQPARTTGSTPTTRASTWTTPAPATASTRSHPSVLRLIMDSLRYFVGECHVDGFRFDLASALAREFHEVDRLSAFFDIIHQDPILSQVKLIAEPWDVGEGGYQVGNFPVLWTEWNGIYRDVVRDFWRGEAGAGDFAFRFTGSADLYERDGRKPFASINFVTAHDGFTLNDLVSYNGKHNEANLEDNRDGTDDNRSWNCGVEGPTDDPEVLALRAPPAAQLPRHALPLAGRADAARRRRERPHAARQQQRVLPGQRDLLARLGARRRARGAARVHAAADRAAARASRVPAHDLPRRRRRRLDAAGRLVVPARRPQDDAPRLAGRAGPAARRVPERRRARGAHGRAASRCVDDSFLVLFNAAPESVVFTLPPRRFGLHWALELSTADAGTPATGASTRAAEVEVEARSLVVLRRVP